MKRCVADFGDSGLDELICPKECPECEDWQDIEGDTVPPSDGGCWYCHRAGGDQLVFSIEFDTNVHLACIQKARQDDPDDPEALILAHEFNLSEEGYSNDHP